ncbi:hypothetical protein EDC94DRAFT_518534 [Helicostylum pulchrum]|nr:hypothetical protein EDC94DRAFT_518534 [Helicostylum pulchrum]
MLNKRKRIDKTVRFDVEHTVIIDTYSPLDYDRGSVFSFPIQYKVNPNISTREIPTLSLEIPSSPCDSEASSPDLEHHQFPPTSKDKKKKPKLTVNTSACDGPLFFTKLSTNHVRYNDDDEDDTINDYLIPSTPTLY